MIDIAEEEITSLWCDKDSELPLVTIKCLTYNHEKYIEQALDGFLSQKTTFSFEIFVHDDASTDGTADIIRDYWEKYPKIIRPVLETENLYSKHDGSLGKVTNAPENVRGKYVAYCEGDDYWIDENKLQMQVDFLEKKQEYGMCYTKARQYSQNNMAYKKDYIGSSVLDFEDLLKNGNRIPTLTVVIRKDLLLQYTIEVQPEIRKWQMGDYPKWLWISRNYKIKFIDIVTGCYRLLENSSSHSNDLAKKLLFEKNAYEIRSYYSQRYNVKIEDFDEAYSSFFIIYEYILESYNQELAKKLLFFYKQTNRKSIKMLLIVFFSRNKTFFNLFRKLK